MGNMLELALDAMGLGRCAVNLARGTCDQKDVPERTCERTCEGTCGGDAREMRRTCEGHSRKM